MVAYSNLFTLFYVAIRVLFVIELSTKGKKSSMKEISVFSQRNTVQSWFSDAVGLRKNCHYIEYIDKSNDFMW